MLLARLSRCGRCINTATASFATAAPVKQAGKKQKAAQQQWIYPLHQQYLTPITAQQQGIAQGLFRKSAQFIGDESTQVTDEVPFRIEIAFAGRSNVGKSSLLNSLVGLAGLAKTSATPGCTDHLNFYELQSDVAPVVLVDVPGYGFAETSKKTRTEWIDLIGGYLQKRNREVLRLTLLLLDARRGVMQGDMDFAEMLNTRGLRFMPVLTKADTLSPMQLQQSLEHVRFHLAGAVSAYPALAVTSAETKGGIVPLRSLIVQASQMETWTMQNI